MTERNIVPPEDVDSLGKLNEWLETCGMPQFDVGDDAGLAKPDPENPERRIWEIEHELWNFGFEFDCGNREQATEGFKRLIRYVTGAFYARFSDERYKGVSWRVRPELYERVRDPEYYAPSGERVDPDEYEGDPADLRAVDTGKSIGEFRCRLGFALA